MEARSGPELSAPEAVSNKRMGETFQSRRRGRIFQPGRDAPGFQGSPGCQIIRCGIVPFQIASLWQDTLHAARLANQIPDTLLLLEHPPTYSVGRLTRRAHLPPEGFPEQAGIEVHAADRGGSITYHGPGQLVGYVIMHLGPHPDVGAYLRGLEETLLLALEGVGIDACRRPGRTGIWVGERKLASIGVKVVRGATKHGFALNVDVDLAPFEHIIPCGLPGTQMTSLAELGLRTTVGEMANRVVSAFATIFPRRLVHTFQTLPTSVGKIGGLLTHNQGTDNPPSEARLPTSKQQPASPLPLDGGGSRWG